MFPPAESQSEGLQLTDGQSLCPQVTCVDLTVFPRGSRDGEQRREVKVRGGEGGGEMRRGGGAGGEVSRPPASSVMRSRPDQKRTDRWRKR